MSDRVSKACLRLSQALILSLVIVAASSPVAFAAGPVAAPEVLSAEVAGVWQADLDYLVDNLPVRHIDFHHAVSEEEFAARAAALRAAIPSMTEPQVIAGLARLVALAHDSHTALNIFGRTVLYYPFQLHCFSDGWRVLAAHPGQAAAVGAEVTAVDGVPLADAITAVRTAFHFSNDSGARAQLPSLLINSELLYGLGVTGHPHSAVWTFTAEDGTSFDVPAEALVPTGIRNWPTAAGADIPVPLYRRQLSNPYYYVWNPELQILYFQYNACREREDLSFSDFTDMLFEAVGQYDFERFIIDLRYNSGGNSGIADALIDRLAADERVNRDGKLFVIIGRRTFSSAVLNALSLQQKTAAIFVGEPSGGSPNHYGELEQLQLPASGLSISYSTKLFQWVQGDADAIYPDIETPASYADFCAGRDPALEAILSY